MRNAFRLVVLGCLFVLSSSTCTCDGGGDTTPPTVIATTPAAGATGVPGSTTVTATFSEAMDPATLTTTTFRLRNGATDIAGTVALDAPTNTARLTPTAPLAADVTYTATVTTGAADTAGNHLAADFTWSFTTAPTPIAWEQVGGQASLAGQASEDPTMMVLGTTPAVGYRHGSFESRLVTWDGSAWDTSAPDPTGGETNSSIYGTPSFCNQGTTVFMAYSHAGDATASDDTFYDRIFGYSWDETAGWQIRNGGEELSTVWDPGLGGANAWEPAIACAVSGDPLVAWLEEDVAADPDTEDGAWIADLPASAASDRSGILSRNDVTADYTTAVRTVGLEVDGTTAYLAQWESDAVDQDRTDLYVTRWDGTTFTPLGASLAEDYDFNNLCVPSLAVLGGELYVAFSQANSTDYTKHVYVAHWTGSAWERLGTGPVSAFSAAEHYDSENPDLAVVDGALWVAWGEQDQSTGTYIFVARWDATASSWVLEGERLNVDPAHAALDPSLAYSPTDSRVYVAFEENTDGFSHIFVKRRQVE
jgi:hypothetical protein